MPLPEELRGRFGTPLWVNAALLKQVGTPHEEEEEEEERSQTHIKEEVETRAGCQTTMTALALHKLRLRRQRCLSNV